MPVIGDHIKCAKILQEDVNLPIHFMKLHTYEQVCTYVHMCARSHSGSFC